VTGTVHSLGRDKSEFCGQQSSCGKSCPILSKILDSNFKTGAINRSATPPGISDSVIRLRRGYGGQVGESGLIIAALL
jgi:hypothetical protein